jgi:adenine-specific DNA-methyltransferase
METTAIALDDCHLLCGDALVLLPTLPDASVQLIVTDPPYYRVKAEGWDRQWPTREAYLGWLRQMAKEWRRVLTSNGSVYCFASPQMAAWVEVTLSETFNVLTRIQWIKDSGWHKKTDPTELCSWLSPREEILFAEQYGSDSPYQDALITENASYWTACERLRGRIFGEAIAEAMRETGTTAKEVTEAIGAYGKVNHGGAVSNWLQGYNIPSPEQYDAMRTFFNTRNCRTDYLRREYEDLRREYEDLRREYEDLRRPFTVSARVPYTDVWDFATVAMTPGKHPCEKPLPLLRHMITASSRPGDTVLDCCMGRGSTLDAARQCGRKAIGIEQDRQWWQAAVRRLSQLELFASEAS